MMYGKVFAMASYLAAASRPALVSDYAEIPDCTVVSFHMLAGEHSGSCQFCGLYWETARRAYG